MNRLSHLIKDDKGCFTIKKMIKDAILNEIHQSYMRS